MIIRVFPKGFINQPKLSELAEFSFDPDQLIQAGDKEQSWDAGSDPVFSGRPLLAQSEKQQFQAGDADLIGIPVHDLPIGGVPGAHRRSERDRDGFPRTDSQIKRERQVHPEWKFEPVLKGGRNQDLPGEQIRISAGEVESLQPSQAFTQKKDFSARKIILDDSPESQNLAVPDAVGIDMAARPGHRPAEPGQFDRVRGNPPSGKIFGQKFPAGGMGAEAVD